MRTKVQRLVAGPDGLPRMSKAKGEDHNRVEVKMVRRRHRRDDDDTDFINQSGGSPETSVSDPPASNEPSESDLAQRVYEPRGAARELWRFKGREVLIEGPAGTGKTRAILEKVLAMACKYPGSRYLICRKTRASMTESVLVTFEEKVLPPESPIKKGPKRQQRTSYIIPNNPQNSVIVVGGLDNAERTLSTEYDVIVVFEATEVNEGEYEMLHRALRNGVVPYQQAICDCNPSNPGHWLNLRAKTPRMKRLKSKHEDNPEFYDHKKGEWTEAGRNYVLGVLENLTGVRKERLRYGRWSAAEGMVYDNWNNEVHNPHLSQSEVAYKVTNAVRIIAGVDWGFTNPGSLSLYAEDNDGRLWRFLQIYRTKKKVDWWVEQAKILHNGYEVDMFVCDPAEPAYIDDFKEAGLPVIEGFNDIERGVDQVRQRLAIQEDGFARLYFIAGACHDPDPYLLEMKRPTCTEEEIENYLYPPHKDGKPLKETPIDENNHGLDECRYVVAYVDGLNTIEIPNTPGYAGSV